MISNCTMCTDQKELYKIVESLLHQKGKAKLPSHNSDELLAKTIDDLFVPKITKIRNDLDSVNVAGRSAICPTYFKTALV